MTKVCTQAGLSSNEHRLLIPFSMLLIVDRRSGDASRELDGLSGGDGNRPFVCFLPTPARPDSSAYGDMDESRLDMRRC